jgi:hypothetical protein
MTPLSTPKLIAVAVSAGMVAAGLLLPNTTRNTSLTPDSTVRVRPMRSRGTAEASPAASASAKADRTASVREAAAPPASKLPPLYAKASASAPKPLPALAKPPTPRRAASDGPLPPFQPPDWSAAEAPSGAPGRSPSVLWLSGVIQGNPKVALLRRGEERFLVREGDTVDGVYRVSAISGSSVTLARGRRRLTLRVGQ